MVEQHVITHLRDGLVNGLSFGPDGHSAEYISSAKQVRLLAESGDRFFTSIARYTVQAR